MPAILPVIAAIASIAGTGIGIGETLSNLPSGGGETPKQPITSAPTAPPATSPQAALLAANAPNVQEQTGGTLAPPAFSQMLANLVGSPGEAQQAQNVVFGSGGQGLTDMLATLQPVQSLTTPSGGG